MEKELNEMFLEFLKQKKLKKSIKLKREREDVNFKLSMLSNQIQNDTRTFLALRGW